MKFQESQRNGPFWSALRKRGYRIEETTLEGLPVLRVTNNTGTQWLTSTNIAYPTTSDLVRRIAQDKQLAYALAGSLGLSVPATHVVKRDESAPIHLLEEYRQLVVKPLDGFGSYGVTLDIADQQELEAALKKAFTYSPVVLVQQQVYGDEYRFTVIDGKVESVLLRETPRVVGDGIHSVAQLIVQENDRRLSRSLRYITYPQLDAELVGETHVDDQTVLTKGEVRELSRATMVKKGATIYERIGETHGSYRTFAEQVAGQLAASFIVVDLFIQDHTVPAAVGNYWFNEVNTSPALRLYYAPVNADDSHVINKIIDKFDKVIANGF